MKPTLVITGLPVRISRDLKSLLEQAISSALVEFANEIPADNSPAALTLNYRDPDYSATREAITPSRSGLNGWMMAGISPTSRTLPMLARAGVPNWPRNWTLTSARRNTTTGWLARSHLPNWMNGSASGRRAFAAMCRWRYSP